MDAEQFEQLVFVIVAELQRQSPIDTGNLRYNAIRYERIDEDTYKIFVDEAIAPYMPFTNEKWISPRWHGKQNPNEHWFDDAADSIAQMIAGILNARIKKRK